MKPANYTVTLPTFHPGQTRIYHELGKHNAVRCPRRWGKTKMMVTMGCDIALKGLVAGLFTPNYKQLLEPYNEMSWILDPVKPSRGSSRADGVIQTIVRNNETGKTGHVDFWSLDDNELAGRGREYDLVLIDEAAFTKNKQMLDIWKKSIAPTMLTRPNARSLVFSTPKGINVENFFYVACKNLDQTMPTFVEHHANILENPAVTAEALEEERKNNHPLVFRQEFLAEFVDWSGVGFFSEDSLLVDGKPVPAPTLCDAVYATIDTAIKTGKKNDGTAVTFWALAKHTSPAYPLMVLDWDIVQIEGASLEVWLPTVYQHLEYLAKECRARNGSIGAFIEDKGSGTILLQQARRRGWAAHAIESALTDMGKDERAINVSGYVYRGSIKVTEHAYRKTKDYKGTHRNHFMAQVTGFHVGVDNIDDDILDTFTYGIALGIGNSEGF